MLTLIRCPFPRVLQWNVKDPGHSAKSAGGRLHLKTQTPLTQRSRTRLTMPLYGHSGGTYPETSSHITSRGNIRPQSSQPAEPLWTDPGIEWNKSAQAINSTSKKKKKGRKKKAQTGNKWLNILPKSSKATKKTPVIM